MIVNFTKKPFLSVLMPVYNSELYLAEAIKSILNQTYSNFEFLIINDGSTDSSKAIIASFKDDRISYIENEKNLGLITTLNKGIDLANGEYIVRMDSDDFSYNERFEKQVAYMELNPDVAISGTWFLKTDRISKSTNPTTPEQCRIKLLDNTVLCHPTVILRKDKIKSVNLKFKPSAIHAEDYQFWIDATLLGLKISNLPIVLLNYRIHPMQISFSQAEIQRQTVNRIRLEYSEFVFGEIIKNNKEIYLQLIEDSISEYVLYKDAKRLVLELLESNITNRRFNQKLIESLFNKHLKRIATNVLKKHTKDFSFLNIVFDFNFYSKSNIKLFFRFR